jgi:GMP synthase (glutamine-hydrolysing)
MSVQPSDSILIVDFGSQVTQLIARRVREAGVYCEIALSARRGGLRADAARGIILSGSPASVLDAERPAHPEAILDSGLPILGICYGQQALMHQLGGEVRAGDHRRVRPRLHRGQGSLRLFDGLWSEGETHQVWMSHGDKVTSLPPASARSPPAPARPSRSSPTRARRIYGDAVPPRGGAHARRRQAAQELRAPCLRLPATGRWPSSATKIAEIRAQVGKNGPGDLRAFGRRRFRGRRRADPRGDRRPADLRVRRPRPDAAARASRSSRLFRDHYNIPLVHVDASDAVPQGLAGVTDPRKKRKFIGATFIDVFEAEAKKIGGAEFLAQGTLYPDVIESVSFTGGPSVTIKSHHNVGGLPERMNMKLVEPLRELFKDEVRALGRELGLPESSSAATRSPARASPSASPAKSRASAATSCARPTRSISRKSATPASTTIWQAFAVLLPVRPWA